MSGTPGRYAAQTNVGADRSRAEIERTLRRYGATAFAYMSEGLQAVVAFKMTGRLIRMTLPLPAYDTFEYSPSGRQRSDNGWAEAYDQAVRQRWRALALIVKAKLEAVDAGITTFEREWLAETVLPSGLTVGEWLEPQVGGILAGGELPLLLSAPRGELGG